METPYIKVKFALSNAAQTEAELLLAPMLKTFQSSAPVVGGIVGTSELNKLWKATQAVQETKDFLLAIGLQPRDETQFFVYKTREIGSRAVYNPHFDMFQSPLGVGPLQDITFRFNTLILGEEDQELHWWDVDRYSDKVEQVLITAADGKQYPRMQAKGVNLDAKLKRLGAPDCIASNLVKRQSQSAFVRTDRLHALNWRSAEPRIIMTYKFTVPWLHIERLRDKV